MLHEDSLLDSFSENKASKLIFNNETFLKCLAWFMVQEKIMSKAIKHKLCFYGFFCSIGQLNTTLKIFIWHFPI